MSESNKNQEISFTPFELVIYHSVIEFFLTIWTVMTCAFYGKHINGMLWFIGIVITTVCLDILKFSIGGFFQTIRLYSLIALVPIILFQIIFKVG